MFGKSHLKVLSSNHTVIVFDQRGITNAIVGSKPYTPQALANDTAGLLDAQKIPKADVMRYSLRSFLAQHLTTDTGRPTCIFIGLTPVHNLERCFMIWSSSPCGSQICSTFTYLPLHP